MTSSKWSAGVDSKSDALPCKEEGNPTKLIIVLIAMMLLDANTVASIRLSVQKNVKILIFEEITYV